MLAKVHSCAVFGLEAHIVTVEVDFNPRAAIPSFTIVGLPDAAVRESRERVRAAIKNSNQATARRRRGRSAQGVDALASMLGDQSQQGSEEHHFGLQFPNKVYVVNLSPADLPKHGPAYDLAIAIGVLAATDQVPLGALERALFIGELSLDGTIRHIKGVLPIAHAAYLDGFERLFVPEEDAPQASLVS